MMGNNLYVPSPSLLSCLTEIADSGQFQSIQKWIIWVKHVSKGKVVQGFLLNYFYCSGLEKLLVETPGDPDHIPA